jgi:hypothetical protein
MITISHSDFLGILFGCAVISLAFGALLGITAMRSALDHKMKRGKKRGSEFSTNV